MNREPQAPSANNQASSAVHLQREVRWLARSLALRRFLRFVVRGLWLALLVIVAGLLLRRAGYAVSWQALLVPAVLVFVVSTLYTWFTGPTLSDLARGFDQHFQLRELLASGYEEARRMRASGAAVSPLGQRLVEQTLLTTYQLRRRLRSRSIVPWREVEMLLAVALMGVGLLIAGRPSALPSVSPLALQALSPPEAEEPQPPETPQEAPEPVSEEQAPLAPEDQAAADALSQALRDNGPTRSAADALDRGDTSAAADELRELADQVDKLSPEARGDLAEALRDAAEQLQPTQPDRARELERQASQIESSPESAAEALDDLAGMIDELGEPAAAASAGEGSEGDPAAGQGQSPGEGGEGEGQGADAQGGDGAGSGLGGESRGAMTDPPSASGEVVPLPPAPEAGGRTTSATGPEGPTVELDAGGARRSATRSAAQSSGSDAPLGGEADPLRIPPEYRDVVENYFSPSE